MYLIIHCTPSEAEALEPAIRDLALLSHQLPEASDHLTAAPTPAAIVAEAIAALDENAAPGENTAAKHMPQALRLIRQRPFLIWCSRSLLLEYEPPDTATCMLQKDAATLAEHLLDAASAEDRNRLRPER